MKKLTSIALLILITAGCTQMENKTDGAKIPLVGTWKLVSGTVIQKNDTAVTDYTQGKSFIKVINDTHFAFLLHVWLKEKTALLPLLQRGAATIHLRVALIQNTLNCNDRQWENNDFTFTITIKNDTLVQSGIEKIDSAGINRLNIEKYVRLKN